ATTRWRISWKNRELKAGREWQWKTYDGRHRTAAAINQGFLGDSENGSVDKVTEGPVGVDFEFVDADIQPIMIHCKVWEIRYSRTTFVGIIRQRSIQNVNEIIPGWIIGLTDGEI